MTSKELAEKIGNLLDEKKAQEINIIDIDEKSGFADYMIIATAGSERHLKSLVDEVEFMLEKDDVFVKRIEGQTSSGWLLMDYEDCIVNILTEEARNKYNIEKIWADCRQIILEGK